MRQFYIRSIISFIVAIFGTSIGIWLLVSFEKFNVDNNNDDDDKAEVETISNLSKTFIGGIVAITFSPLLFFKQLYTFLRDVLPYLTKEPEQFFQEALFGVDYLRRDFLQDLGFMGQIKKEAAYLFNFLRMKKDEGAVRMCLFVDDLDRCNSKTVVSVLEAVFLLLAIDTRLVVASIDEHYTFHDRAGINGYDFLEKIVLLPFCKYISI